MRHRWVKREKSAEAGLLLIFFFNIILPCAPPKAPLSLARERYAAVRADSYFVHRGGGAEGDGGLRGELGAAGLGVILVVKNVVHSTVAEHGDGWVHERLRQVPHL